MSSNPSPADLSRLYNSNWRTGVSNTVLNTALRSNTDLLLQRQLLAVDDSRSALLLGISSLSPYEDELARQAQAASVLRRYHDLKILEAASAAAATSSRDLSNMSNLAASDLRGNTNLAPRLSPIRRPSRITMSPTTHSLGAPAWSGVASGEPALQPGPFAQERLGRACSAFDRVKAQEYTAERHLSIHTVEHPVRANKTDKLTTSDLQEEDEDAYFRASAGSKERFPVKLYRMIYEMKKEGRSDVVSFLAHGKAFAIHDEKSFVQDVMPRYFANCQLSSLQKQLNLYGFHKITVGKDRGKLRYFHASFLDGKPSLTESIQRKRTSAAAKRKQLS